MLQKIAIFGILTLLLVSCAQKEARRPVSVRSGTFLKESAERNKMLIAQEEAMIQNYIANDSTNVYLASNNGFWYFYNEKSLEEIYMPQAGDTLTYSLEISKLAGETIYKKDELGIQEYVVDKQQTIAGLRYALQLMKKGETVTFLFPSHIAYGYHGDNKRIGTNVPIQSTITLLDIKKENKNLETDN